MTDEMRSERFVRLWPQLGGHDLAQGKRWANRVLAGWSEAGRHYHNVQHLDECLAEFDGVRALMKQPELVEVALWFHDVVYDARAVDNEARSAALAVEFLHEIRADGALVSDADVAKVERLILATRTHVAEGDSDTALMLDIDLSILGLAASRFDQYEDAIRREYSHVPLAIFAEKRGGILTRFVQRPALFSTPYFIQRYEATARVNLARSIARLSAVAQ